jgi:hypothetical protein
MVNVYTDRPLQDPREAWRTRRLLDASRAILTGTIAFGFCLPAVVMIGWDATAAGDLGRVLGLLVITGFLIWMLISVFWLIPRRSRGGVKVVDRFETNLSQVRRNFWWRFLPAYALVLGTTALWSILFNVMPGSGVVLTMWLVTAMLAGLFVALFVLFQFWEDLVFAGSVAMAWSLYLLPDRRLAPLVIVPLLAVVVATVCLDRRWPAWVSDLRAADAETESRG